MPSRAKNFNAVQAVADNGFASFSALLIHNLLQPDFILERNEEPNNLKVLTLLIGLSFLDFLYLIHESRLCSDLYICLVWLKPTDATR